MTMLPDTQHSPLVRVIFPLRKPLLLFLIQRKIKDTETLNHLKEIPVSQYQHCYYGVETTTPALCGFLGNYCNLGMSTCLLIKVASTSSHNLTNQTSYKHTIIIEDQRQQLSVKELSLQGSTVAINKREELLYLLGARKAPHWTVVT